jgi:uncharacterized SAM-binding protein YcdF (DUF218 family)
MKKRNFPLYFILAFCFMIIALHGLWLPFLAKFLIVNEPLAPADVILVPSGNEEDLRITYAARVYKKGFSDKVLLSGRLSLEKETGINLGKIYVMSLGVPENAIISEMDSVSTVENALFSKRIIEERKFKTVILVTYPPHTRRSQQVFRRILPRDVKLIIACDPGSFDEKNWWRNPETRRSVVYEYFSFFWYLLFKR